MAPKLRKHDDDTDSGGDLRSRLVDLIGSLDEDQLQKLADFISSDAFDEDTDGLAVGSTSNNPRDDSATVGEMGEKRRRPSYSGFSESQRSDLGRIQRYARDHADDIRRAGGNPAEFVEVGARALEDGYSVMDILGRGA